MPEKRPTAPPTKRVKSGTSSVTRSPLSQQTVQQIKGESSGYLSAAPSGSTVKAQEASTKKAKKKRPWLIQLAVISTALCLLGALIVGLVYNLGDWFNKEEKDPQEEKLVEVEVPENEPSEVNRPVVKGAFANLDQVEYLKISEKHPYLRWVSLDVGTAEPVKIKIKDDQFDRFEKALDQSQEGDELKVIISEKDGLLTFDDLKKLLHLNPEAGLWKYLLKKVTMSRFQKTKIFFLLILERKPFPMIYEEQKE